MRYLKSLATTFVAIVGFSSTTWADGPVISMLVTANGNSTSLSLTGNPTTQSNVFNYSSSFNSSGAWAAGWNFNASNAGSSNGLDRVFTAGNFVVSNNSSSSIVFDFVFSMPIALAGPGMYGGSVSAGLTTQGPGSFSSVGEAPIWTGSTGGLTIATMLNGPTSVVRTATGSSTIGTDAFGQPIPSLPGPAFGQDLTVRMQFVLSAGASASFTSVLVGQVPTPGATFLLGLGGLVSTGRRRRG